jgi:hypothetical protein
MSSNQMSNALVRLRGFIFGIWLLLLDQENQDVALEYLENSSLVPQQLQHACNVKIRISEQILLVKSVLLSRRNGRDHSRQRTRKNET